MEVIGTGFIAGHVRRSVADHRDVVVLAAGVSSTGTTAPESFAREADLLGEVLKKCAQGGQRLVFFSTASASMYGAPGCPGLEDVPAVPQSPYGWHKLRLEERVADSGVSHLILRLGHAIGSGQPPHQLLPALIRQVRSGTVRIYRGARRDIIDIADVMAVIDALLAAEWTGTVNVASGVVVPIENVVAHIEDRLGERAGREYVTQAQPTSAAIGTAKLQRLVPAVADRMLSDDYYRAVLDRYIASYTESRTDSRTDSYTTSHTAPVASPVTAASPLGSTR